MKVSNVPRRFEFADVDGLHEDPICRRIGRRNIPTRHVSCERKVVVSASLSKQIDEGSGAKLVGIESGVISGLNFNKPIRRLAAAEGDNANDDRYSKLASW